MRSPALLVLLLLSACSGGGAAAPSPTGSSSPAVARVEHIAFGGLDRTYRLYVPGSLPGSRPAPLVLVLHGRGGTGQGAEATTGFDREADARGLLVVYPFGSGRSWNAGGCCLPASDRGTDDVGFLNAVLDRVEANHRVDANRVYVTGLSNGGMMAYRLACQDGGRFAAIAPVAASLQVPACTPSRPVSVIHIHGAADTTVPVQGGLGPEDRVDNPPALTTLAQFASQDGCAAQASVSRRGKVTERDWTRCRAGTEVTFFLLAGVGHKWPQAAVDPLSATSEIAGFFAAHPRAAAA